MCCCDIVFNLLLVLYYNLVVVMEYWHSFSKVALMCRVAVVQFSSSPAGGSTLAFHLYTSDPVNRGQEYFIHSLRRRRSYEPCGVIL